MTPADLRDFAGQLADLADGLTMAAFGPRQSTEAKPDGTWVTEVDLAVERALRTAIGDEFPEHAFLGEEDGRSGPIDAPCWIVDPIDGTTNFAKGNPIFATLIAVQMDGDEVAGVVSAPALTARWDACRGVTSRQNGRAIAVSTIDDLSDAEISFGDLACFPAVGLAPIVAALTNVTSRQRGYGDFWQHCLVASGSTEIAIEAQVSIWDLAAVKIVVEQAGGTFTDLLGTVTADGGSALSTNGRLHAQVLNILDDARIAGDQ